MANYDIAQTRELVNRVRSLTLKQIKEVLEDIGHKKHEKAFYQALLLKLASNALPRINEIQGEGGEPLQMVVKRAYVNERLESNVDLEIGTNITKAIETSVK